MNQVLEQRILKLLAQSYALNYEQLNTIYEEVQSFDKIVAIIEAANRNNTELLNAYENWKSSV